MQLLPHMLLALVRGLSSSVGALILAQDRHCAVEVHMPQLRSGNRVKARACPALGRNAHCHPLSGRTSIIPLGICSRIFGQSVVWKTFRGKKTRRFVKFREMSSTARQLYCWCDSAWLMTQSIIAWYRGSQSTRSAGPHNVACIAKYSKPGLTYLAISYKCIVS